MKSSFLEKVKLHGKALKVLLDSDNRLKTVCSYVDDVEDVKDLAVNMAYTMLSSGGCGIAANQVGECVRVICIMQNKKSILAMVNPEIVRAGKSSTLSKEGCLSTPGKFFEMKRSKSVTVKFTNLYGLDRKMSFSKLQAIIIQHEIDHLEGVVISEKGRLLK